MNINFKEILSPGSASHPESVHASDRVMREVAIPASMRHSTVYDAFMRANHSAAAQNIQADLPPMTVQYPVVAEAESIAREAAAVQSGDDLIDPALAYAQADPGAVAVDPVVENRAWADRAEAEADIAQAAGGMDSEAFFAQSGMVAPPAYTNAAQPAAPAREYSSYDQKVEAGIAPQPLDQTVEYWNDLNAMPNNSGLDPDAIRQQINDYYSSQEPRQ